MRKRSTNKKEKNEKGQNANVSGLGSSKGRGKIVVGSHQREDVSKKFSTHVRDQ